MPTTYKVLGQASATAAAASKELNLIKDPGFEGFSAAGGWYFPGYQAWFNLPGTMWMVHSVNHASNWTWVGLYPGKDVGVRTDSSFAGAHIQNGGSLQKTTRYGNNSIAQASNADGQSGYIPVFYRYGLSTGRTNNIGPRTQDNQNFNGNTSIPVTGSTTYYFGLDYSSYQSTTCAFDIQWFTATGQYISSTVYDSWQVSTSGWERISSSATSPANAAYAGIEIMTHQYNVYTTINRNMFFLDGIYFSKEPDAVTAFPDTYNPTDNRLTAPFTDRLSADWAGTPNASVTVKKFAGAQVDLYTVPASTQAVVSTVVIANTSTSAQTYRIAVVPSGQTHAAKHFVAFDAPVAANSTDTFTIGMTLAAGDKIRVSSDSAQVSFTAFGSEIA